MAIWIQSLSWTLIYALGQGFVVYASLWLVLKLMPSASSNVKYHLSLSALTVLLTWFVATWWQQYHSLAALSEQFFAKSKDAITLQQQLLTLSASEYNSNYNTLLSATRIVLPWLSAGYVAGLLFMLVRLSAGMQQLFSLRKSRTNYADAALDQILVPLKKRIHFESNVQLVVSLKAQVPMVIGCLKPIILMPAAALTQLSAEQLETILLHELAHIKRYDYLVNILQSVAETILFFNPFVWMISAITRREREHCCDDLVLQHSREPIYYATALATLASQPGSATVFAVAASGQSNQLFNRIKRIMEMKKNPFSYSRMVAAILIVAAIGCTVTWYSPSFAQSKKGKGTSESATVTKAKATATKPVNQAIQEQIDLIKRLAADHLIDDAKGYFVEKNKNVLTINGKQQTDAIARKYLSNIKQQDIFIHVKPFGERLIQHPDASILQIIAPVNFSSGCVEYSTTKPGC